MSVVSRQSSVIRRDKNFAKFAVVVVVLALTTDD
jgi:hypothetical protein